MVGLCRLCASLRKTDVLVAIKDNSNEICDKLLICCQLDIKLNDGLPKTICQECITNLNSSHKFYTKVQEAQETLQALYPTQGNKIVHIPTQQTLSSHEDITSDVNQDESNVSKEIRNIAESKQQIKLDELKTLEGEGQGVNICEKLIFEDSNESVELIENLNENLHEVKSPRSNAVNRIDEEDHEKGQTLNNNHDRYDLVISEEKDSQSNSFIQQINDMLSDDEINVEIEYMECLDDEEEENYVENNKDIEETFEKSMPSTTFLSHDFKVSSWKNYKHLCFICDNIFTSFIDLKNHIVREHNVKQLDNIKYKCYDCRKIIARYSFFLNHVRAIHHPVLKLKCDACDLSCQTFDELTDHRSIDCVEAKNFENTIACSYCFKSFNNAYGLQNHVKFQHISSSKVIYKCKLCNKEFQYKSCLKAHERLHSDTKQFSCDYCDKSFHTKLGLEQHLYAHVEEKVFRCNICDRSYKTSKSLDDHRKLHTEEKAFKCQFCSKVFSRKIQKLTHERTHTGEMPYSCEQCDKKFRYRSALFVHSKIHTGHKPYSCVYCDKTFADSSNRNKHVRRMHLNCITAAMTSLYMICRSTKLLKWL